VKALEAMTPLILKRASASRSSGQWSDDDYNVLENGIVVGRIFKVLVAPAGSPLDVGERSRRAQHQARRARLRGNARWRLDGPDHKNGFDRGYSCRAIDCWGLLDCC